MTNQNSRPSIEPAAIPPDFEATAGNTRTTYLQAISSWLRGAAITGINEDTAESVDAASLQKQINDLQYSVESLLSRTPRRIVSNVIAGSKLIVSFQELQTKNYSIDVTFVEAASLPAYTSLSYYVYYESKKTNQFEMKVLSSPASLPVTIEITVTPMDGI